MWLPSWRNARQASSSSIPRLSGNLPGSIMRIRNKELNKRWQRKAKRVKAILKEEQAQYADKKTGGSTAAAPKPAPALKKAPAPIAEAAPKKSAKPKAETPVAEEKPKKVAKSKEEATEDKPKKATKSKAESPSE